MPLAAARASHGVRVRVGPGREDRGPGMGRAVRRLRHSARHCAPPARFTPLTYPNPWLTVALLCSSLLLSSFKLRLPLGSGVSTMSMACAADLAGADDAWAERRDGDGVHRRALPVHVAGPAIAAALSRGVQRRLGGDHGAGGRLDLARSERQRREAPTLTTMVVPLVAISAGYFLVNTGLVATAVGLTNRESPIRAWYREFFWSGPSYFLSGAAAGVISLIITNDAYILLPLAFVPLYVSYRAYHLSLDRIEAERRHAEELAQALDRATQSEAALAEEKERLVLESSRLIVTVQTIRDGVMTVDRDGGILLMNNQARKLSALAPTPLDARPIVSTLLALGLSARRRRGCPAPSLGRRHRPAAQRRAHRRSDSAGRSHRHADARRRRRGGRRRLGAARHQPHRPRGT